MIATLPVLLARCTAAASAYYTNPIIAGDWPDPGAIYVNGSFLVATTGGGFALHSSDDLGQWSAAGSVFNDEDRPRWAVGDFWAPEIHRMPGGSFNVYHTARDSSGRLSIGCATSSSPTGPFKALDMPLARDLEGQGMFLDSHYFFDNATSVGYLVWKHGSVTPPAEMHTWLYMQPLDASGTQLVGERRTVLRNNLSSWEAGVVEAPWIIRPHDSAYYYLFYSAAHCCDGSGSYAVGVARSTAVTGPYEKYHKNPILASTKDVEIGFDGTGHCSVIQDPKDTQIWIIFYHAYRRPATHGKRALMMDTLRFDATDGGWPQLTTGSSSPSTKPTPLPPIDSMATSMLPGLQPAVVPSATQHIVPHQPGCAPQSCTNNATIRVSVDVTRDALPNAASCQSIQAALDCIPNDRPVSAPRITILVPPGAYRNQSLVVAAGKGRISLVGDHPSAHAVVVMGRGFVGIDCGGANATLPCGVLSVEADDFVLANITLANAANATTMVPTILAGKPFAIEVGADRCAIYNTRLLGKDDSVFTGSHRVYFRNTTISGSTDFNFGQGSAVYDRCTLVAQPGQFWSFITAHAGTPAHNNVPRTSYLIQDSRLPLVGAQRLGTTFLGRPWGPMSSVVYKNTWMDKHIATAGWSGVGRMPMQNVSYAEFNSSGPGADPGKRASFSKQLTAAEAAEWTVERVLQGWVPPTQPPLL